MGNEKQLRQEKQLSLILLFAGAFIVHIVCAMFYMGHDTDMNCFFWWSHEVVESGIGQFYKLESFTDYPPGYMYILYVIGVIKNLLGFDSLTMASAILIKMPAMLCDLGIGYIIYKIASKYTTDKYAMFFAAAFMFNPAIVINSAIWGQVDSVFTLCVLLMCYFVTEKKLPFAYIALAIGITIKPQTLLFSPVLLFGIIDQVFLENFSWKRMFTQLGIGLATIAGMILVVAPFGLKEVFSQYVDTVGSYEYASVNAYNLWVLMGKNWASQDDIFMFLSYKTWGTLFIIATIVVAAYFCIRNKESESKYYLSGAFIVTSVFMLSVRMHERYMYPALALLLVVCAVKRNSKYVIAFAALSFIHFLNAYHVLFHYDPENYNSANPVFYIVSFLGLASFAYFAYLFFTQDKAPRAMTVEERVAYEAEQAKNKVANKYNRKSVNKNNKNNNRNVNGKTVNASSIETKPKMWKILASDVMPKWTKWDFIIMFAITAVYACIAFYNLGDKVAPQTSWSSEQTGAEITVDLGEEKTVGDIYFFLGNYENRKFDVQLSSDGTTWNALDVTFTEEETELPGVINVCSVFCWNKQSITKNTRYIKFIQRDDKAVLMELMMYDEAGNVITPVNTSDYPELFDEQNIFDGTYSYMNSTYFDEIYHGRTAYEMIQGIYCYENTHPPLGKAIMAIGILIFGMCPFGWRFMGTLLGVLMVPIMYMLGRKLTKKTWLTSVITLLFTFDFMHFAQTRIATIDVFVTFFIMLMYYFMLCYYKMSFYDKPFKKTLIPLALSGICMGLGCASKWTGVYAGIGLAVIFFAVMLRRYMEYKTALADPNGSSEGIEHKFIVDNYKLLTLKTLAFCIIAFIVVPGIIYTAAYIPHMDGTERNVVERMLASQKIMYDYHSDLDATHPYSSEWFKWPVISRPILYYLEDVGTNLKAGISAMGNPFVWWAGIPAFIYAIYLIIKDRDRTALFITVGYMAQYLPWLRVTRCTFIYHYFPSVPFVVMLIGYCMYRLTKDKPKRIIAVAIYTAAVVALFAAFYPVLAGHPITVEYGKLLKWFDSWVLLY